VSCSMLLLSQHVNNVISVQLAHHMTERYLTAIGTEVIISFLLSLTCSLKRLPVPVSCQLASKLLAVASQSLAILPDWVRRFQLTRLSVPSSTYPLVACLVGTGSVVLVDQTTDGPISRSSWPWHLSDATANMMMIKRLPERYCIGWLVG